jgi:hypothetical protein
MRGNISSFLFQQETRRVSGALFDLVKLTDVSKDTIASMFGRAGARQSACVDKKA